MGTFRRILLLLVLFSITVKVHAKAPFQSLKFKDAVAKAKEDKKFVFIDFYTTWCGPCKMMDQSTFPDPKVMAWLKEKAVAVKYDAEVEVALAERFRVDGYPTLVFLKPDGTEFDRIAGYVEPEEFMVYAHGVEKGESSLDRMRKEVEANGNDPLARMQLGAALAQSGKQVEALKEYLWCWDEGVKKDPAFVGIRNSYLLMELYRLSKVFEPAGNALTERSKAADARLRSGTGSEADVTDMVTLNRLLDKQAQTMATYDVLVASTPKSPLIKAFNPFLLDMRIASKRYADIIASDETQKDIALRLKHLSGKSSGLGAVFNSDDAQQTAMRKAEAFERLMGYYQAYVGVADHTKADDLAGKILKIDSNPDVLGGLAWSAYLSGKATETHIAQAEKALEASGGASVSVIDTLVRILYQLGRKDEAIARTRAAIFKTTDPMEKGMLGECLKDFGVLMPS